MWFWLSSFIAVIATLAGIFVYIDNQPSKDALRHLRMAESADQNSESFQATNQSMFILGATGETGKVLLRQALERKVFSKVVLIGRREVKFDDPLYDGVEQRIVDFEKLDDYADAFKDIDIGFCCLGTTRGKSGVEGFKRVDFDYTLNAAQLAKQSGCKHFTLVSSQGANKDSWFLYPQTKGQIEAAIRALAFPRYSVFRPSMLMGERQERRPLEMVLQPMMKAMYKLSPTVMTTPFTTLSKAMINNALAASDQPNELYENKAIYELAGELKKK